MVQRWLWAALSVYVLVTSLQSWAGGPLCREVAFTAADKAYAIFIRWSIDDFIARDNSDILLTCSNCPTVAQHIDVTVQNTPSLYARILELAQGAKYVQRSQAQNALKIQEKRQFNRGIRPYLVDGEVDERLKKKVRKHNLRFQALLEEAGEVEVGAWDIVLENGDHRTAIFTSNDRHQIDKFANEKSLRGILATIPQGQIVKQIEFIHNHPSSVSLSAADQNVLAWAKGFVGVFGYRNVPVKMTAIHQMNDAVIAMSIAL